MWVCLELVLGLVMEAQDCEVVTVLEEGQGEPAERVVLSSVQVPP